MVFVKLTAEHAEDAEILSSKSESSKSAKYFLSAFSASSAVK